MFEWLEEEMASVNTNKFFLVDGPIKPEDRELVEQTELAVPESYKEFVIRFGNARFYRKGTNYLIQIYAVPVDAESDDGQPLLHFGRTEGTLAYFYESLLADNGDSPVIEWRHNQGFRQTADGFEEWLKAKCIAARKRYKKKEWQAIEEGPPPFTEQELAVVEARKHYRWQVVGVAPNEDLRFEIHNGSNLILPYLSVGIRGKLRPPKTGPLHGGGYLPTTSIQPGQSGIIEYDCYKQFIAPEDTEVFELPEPGPEDREQYWEFKALA